MNLQEFLQILLANELFSGAAVEGIIRQLVSKGLDSLSSRQREVLDSAFPQLLKFEEEDEDYYFILQLHNRYGLSLNGTLEFAEDLKKELGYIPDKDSREEDVFYMDAISEHYK